jgi:hypothetical protein
MEFILLPIDIGKLASGAKSDFRRLSRESFSRAGSAIGKEKNGRFDPECG